MENTVDLTVPGAIEGIEGTAQPQTAMVIHGDLPAGQLTLGISNAFPLALSISCLLLSHVIATLGPRL